MFQITLFSFFSIYKHALCFFLVCQTKLDLAFVIDGSGSVGYKNFLKVKKFLKDIVEFYNVGFDQTRVALITYSYRVSYKC